MFGLLNFSLGIFFFSSKFVEVSAATRTAYPTRSKFPSIRPKSSRPARPSRTPRSPTKRPVNYPSTAPYIISSTFKPVAVVPLKSEKRGVVGNFVVRFSNLSTMNLAWYYTYGLDSLPELRAFGIEWVPMTNCWARIEVPVGRVQYLLGFNEPELKSQNYPDCKPYGIEPEETWPYWQVLEKRANTEFLISPAPIMPRLFDWMPKFLAGNATYKPRVDMLAVHWYNPNATELLEFMDRAWATFRLPMWLTEFSMTDRNITANVPCRRSRYNTSYVREFIKIAVTGLEARPYVFRYAWYSDTINTFRACFTLWNKDDGSISDYGKVYAGIEQP